MVVVPLARRSSWLLGATLLACAWMGVGSHAEAQVRRFQIARNGGSRIQFVSDAPLERITGVSGTVSGELNLDPNALGSARGTVAVDIASIRTGLDLRDEHLHGPDWLDAGHHPQATFEITAVEGATALRADETLRVTLRGRFTLHGVTREISAPAQVRLMPLTDELRAQGVTGDVIRGQASFDVELSDYQVSISAPVRLKVSNTIRVNVTLRAVAG